MARKKENKKASGKPIKIFTLDTETRGLFGQVFRVGVYDGDQTIKTNTYQEIKNMFDKYTDEYECHVYIHNLDFDLAKLAKELVPEVKFSDSIFIENNVAVFRSANIILHDSMKLLPGSLDSISKSFNLKEKAKIDLSDHIFYNGYAVDQDGKPIKLRKHMNKRMSLGNYFENVPADEKELNEYLDSDLISLYEIIMQVIEISGIDVEDFVTCPTTASLAMKVFKLNYEDDYKDICSTNWRGEWNSFCEEFIRQGYYGGRTEVFKPELKDGYHYDVNSLYPYVMRDNEFPVGYFKKFDGNKALWAYRHWQATKIGAGFAEANIYVPEDMHIPPLPIRHSNKLMFPVGNLSGVWTFPEIENAVKHGCVIKKIKQVIYFKKTAPVFNAFIEDHEELKTNSTGAKRAFAKLMQNSLYGKFGMNRLRKTFMDIEDESELEPDTYIKVRNPMLDKDFIITTKKVNAQYIQPHVAAYVTSLARLVLYEALVNQKGVSYCDTDSIACKNEMIPEVVHPTRYGAWDLENIVTHGIYLQPKLYMEMHPEGKPTLKAKGIPGNILGQFNSGVYVRMLNDIKSGAERIEIFGHEDDSKNVIKGEVRTRRKFASMMKAKIDIAAVDEYGIERHTSQVIRKGINLRAKQKRIMDFKNNTSKPHKVKLF